MINISSFSNPKYKHLKSLIKSRNRKKEGVFIMEGREELDLALKTGLVPKQIAFTESYIDEQYISETYSTRRIEILHLSKALFDDLAYQKVPGNYIAVFDGWSAELSDIDSQKSMVILEGLEKPGNLGAILRTCSAAGINNVIVTESEIDLFNPNVIRNSRGALLNLNVVFTSNEDLLPYLEKHNFSVHATAIDANSKDYRTLYKAQKQAIVFGSESKGISSFWIENSQDRITIPMKGYQDSLNLSVSVGIVLFSILED